MLGESLSETKLCLKQTSADLVIFTEQASRTKEGATRYTPPTLRHNLLVKLFKKR